jgi:Leucine-rich repeat (LRR) protein
MFFYLKFFILNNTMSEYKLQKELFQKSRKYKVYENDLKFPDFINPEMSIWEDDVKEKYFEGKVNTLDYRLLECEKNNFEYLDLSYMSLDCIPDLSKLKNYNRIKKIKFLFINDNNIEHLEDTLDIFEYLEVLDISNNELRKIKKMPSSLKELVCHGNKLTKICSSDYLHILDCSFNRMECISEFPSLTKLICEDNSIKELQTFLNVKFLTCKNNPMIRLSCQPSVEFLNIENTLLKGDISEMKKLKWLICHNTQITGITKLISLEHIEMTNCKLTEIPYMRSLQDILCDKKSVLRLDKKFKLKNYLIETDYSYYIFE